jgi:hypothetical protein
VEELDRRDPQYFQQRNAAAKLALEKMSVEKRAEIELGLERRRAEGNPENVQRLYVNFADSERTIGTPARTIHVRHTDSDSILPAALRDIAGGI